ncbi:hypothetical protein [Ekhidna sp.]|uniref:hypothetical protein n=1 Tax=Ekhidna sp. TaxID=2608089 RepID=UPI003297411A
MKYLFILAVLIGSCKASNTSTSKGAPAPTESQDLLTEESRQIDDSMVKIEFKNRSGAQLSILNPMEKRVDLWSADGWTKVNILYCDCGAPPCPAPPTERPVGVDRNFTFSWDRQIENCLETDSGRITKKTDAPKGEYRVLYSFKDANESTNQLEARFTLE